MKRRVAPALEAKKPKSAPHPSFRKDRLEISWEAMLGCDAGSAMNPQRIKKRNKMMLEHTELIRERSNLPGAGMDRFGESLPDAKVPFVFGEHALGVELDTDRK